MSISKIESLIREKQNEQNDNTFSRKRCFLMCKSCYWCASCLSADDGSISRCPVCGTNKMDCLSISHSECYRLDYDQVRGMVLQFWTKIEGDIPSWISLTKKKAISWRLDTCGPCTTGQHIDCRGSNCNCTDASHNPR